MTDYISRARAWLHMAEFGGCRDPETLAVLLAALAAEGRRQGLLMAAQVCDTVSDSFKRREEGDVADTCADAIRAIADKEEQRTNDH